MCGCLAYVGCLSRRTLVRLIDAPSAHTAGWHAQMVRVMHPPTMYVASTSCCTMKIGEEYGHKQDTAVEALLRLLDLLASSIPLLYGCSKQISSAGQQSPASTADTLAVCIGMQCRMCTCSAARACLVYAVFCRFAVLMPCASSRATGTSALSVNETSSAYHTLHVYSYRNLTRPTCHSL